MTLKNKERKQAELDLTTIAYNIKLIHNHKMNKIKQRNKKKTHQTKTEKLFRNSNIKKFQKNLYAHENIHEKISSLMFYG